MGRVEKGIMRQEKEGGEEQIRKQCGGMKLRGEMERKSINKVVEKI